MTFSLLYIFNGFSPAMAFENKWGASIFSQDCKVNCNEDYAMKLNLATMGCSPIYF